MTQIKSRNSSTTSVQTAKFQQRQKSNHSQFRSWCSAATGFRSGNQQSRPESSKFENYSILRKTGLSRRVKRVKLIMLNEFGELYEKISTCRLCAFCNHGWQRFGSRVYDHSSPRSATPTATSSGRREFE